MEQTQNKIKTSTKFKNWFINQAIKAQWIHKSRESRKRFTLFYLLFILIMFLLYCTAGALLFVDGLRFYQDGSGKDTPNTEWYTGVKYKWAFVVSIVLLAILFIITFLAGLYVPILYKQSKIFYFESDEYKQNVIKYSNIDLKKYPVKKIKWLKKLGYIDKVTYLFYKKPEKKK